MKNYPIDDFLKKRKVIITAGTGGVGKTTVSAALGLRAAALGRRVVVITIDPAKRLATSLGLKDLGDSPSDLTDQFRESIERAKESGELEGATQKGSFSALMPDSRETFQSFIARLSPSKDFQKRVFKNPIFQILSREFSGANEYMALQKLEQVSEMKAFDLIILDTPPSRNTVTFLDAPNLVSRLFEERLIKWLVLPANRIVSAGMKKAFGILEKLTGSGFLSHLLEFANLLFEVQNAFMYRVRKVTEILGSKDLGFIMVTAPQPSTLNEFEHLLSTVREKNFRLDGVIVNRTLESFKVDESEKDQIGDEQLKQAFEIVEYLQKNEKKVIDKLESLMEMKRQGPTFFTHVPQLSRDVHSIEDLFYVSLQLG